MDGTRSCFAPCRRSPVSSFQFPVEASPTRYRLSPLAVVCRLSSVVWTAARSSPSHSDGRGLGGALNPVVASARRPTEGPPPIRRRHPQIGSKSLAPRGSALCPRTGPTTRQPYPEKGKPLDKLTRVPLPALLPLPFRWEGVGGRANPWTSSPASRCPLPASRKRRVGALCRKSNVECRFVSGCPLPVARCVSPMRVAHCALGIAHRQLPTPLGPHGRGDARGRFTLSRCPSS